VGHDGTDRKDDDMTITARFPGRCATCGGAVSPGQQVEWDKASKTVRHLDGTCDSASPATDDTVVTLSFTPTGEQTTALELFATGESLAIEAGAGTGKTSTLRLLAESTNRRGQYIAFNKAIVVEAGSKMPATVTCSTAHSLAYRNVGKQYSDRLRNSRRMRPMDLANHLGLEEIATDTRVLARSFLGGVVLKAVTRFCQTADDEIDAKHVPYIEGIDVPVDGVRTYENNRMVARALVPALRRAWSDLMSQTGILPFRHDHYLKAWQLDSPHIQADYILFDEAQDANPVMVAIVAAQTHAQLVWVGDSQQQIYTFTGAVNALGNVPADQRAFLSQSFRFGTAIADVANTILDRLPEAEVRLVGTDTINSIVGSVADPDAILCRTNAAAVETVLNTQQQGRQAALVGGGEEVVRFAKGAQDLMSFGRTEHPDLACFDSWGDVQSYVTEDEQGSELRLLVQLVDRFTVPTILSALDRVIREEDADVTVSTAHKAKGREWDSVQLAGDFPEPEKQGDEELRLLYVACTRAKRELDIDAVAITAAAPVDEAVKS
jgi:UvrD-like helicase C-terminal domain/AAA domain